MLLLFEFFTGTLREILVRMAFSKAKLRTVQGGYSGRLMVLGVGALLGFFFHFLMESEKALFSPELCLQHFTV